MSPWDEGLTALLNKGKYEELGTAFIRYQLHNDEDFFHMWRTFIETAMSLTNIPLFKLIGASNSMKFTLNKNSKEEIIKAVVEFEDLIRRVDEFVPELELVWDSDVIVLGTKEEVMD